MSYCVVTSESFERLASTHKSSFEERSRSFVNASHSFRDDVRSFASIAETGISRGLLLVAVFCIRNHAWLV
jgi:hypothetical protein